MSYQIHAIFLFMNIVIAVSRHIIVSLALAMIFTIYGGDTILHYVPAGRGVSEQLGNSLTTAGSCRGKCEVLAVCKISVCSAEWSLVSAEYSIETFHRDQAGSRGCSMSHHLQSTPQVPACNIMWRQFATISVATDSRAVLIFDRSSDKSWVSCDCCSPFISSVCPHVAEIVREW